MFIASILINNYPYNLIILGYCGCGCGKKTKISHCNNKKYHHEIGKPYKFIRGHNIRKHHNILDSKGYILVWQPQHPKSASGYVHEHILVMEQFLGNPIDGIIHHKDNNKTNNTISNLVVFPSQREHMTYHRRLYAFQQSGHWNYRKCIYCHKWDSPNNLIIQHHCYHRGCRSKYDASRGHRKPRMINAVF